MNAPLDPAVAAVRRGVRLALADLAPDQRVLVACSGGPDSMALAAAAAFEGAKAGWQVGAVVIDHGLRPESAEVSAEVARRLSTHPATTGLAPVATRRVGVGSAGGVEAAARDARYAELRGAATSEDAVVLLGHTRDDQAETVLLGLARGSGSRSLAGMRARIGPFRRPLLDVTREQTLQACGALGLPVWHDPANDDPRFARVRVRRTALPMLEELLGPGIAAALARTAELACADADALDALADALAVAGLTEPTGGGSAVQVDVGVVAPAAAALRWRVLRRAALAAGSPAGELFVVHVRALDALVTDWHGQGPLDLPGHVSARRQGQTIDLARTRPPA